MESLIEQLTTNPVMLAVVIVLAILILFSFVKKLVKLALVTVAILTLYLGYLTYTGKEVPTTPEELKEKIQKGVEEGKEVIDQKVKEINRSLKKKTSELMEEKVEKLFEDTSSVHQDSSG